MSYYNRINQVKKEFEWPSEQLFVIETNSDTDAEGTIHINYDGVSQIDTSVVEIFKSTAPLVPETKYTKTGINLYTGTQFDTSFTACTKNGKVSFSLNWSFKTNLLSVDDGDFYTIQIKINDIINIVFVVKIRNAVI